jgi:hypothetical protein
MAIVTLPIGIDFLTWANQIQDDLPDLSLPQASNVNDWWDWANQVIAINELAYVPTATKTVFRTVEDWRHWAIYFVETLNLAGS